MNAENLEISAILTRKFEGVDCNEDESAALKQYLKSNNLNWDKPTGFCLMISVQFPIEYSEAYQDAIEASSINS